MSLEHFESICGTHSVLMYAELEAEVSVSLMDLLSCRLEILGWTSVHRESLWATDRTVGSAFSEMRSALSI